MAVQSDRIDISVLSTEYVRVKVYAKENGVVVDPTSNSVDFAFKTTKAGNPVNGDWVAGSWETDDGVYYARINVGPSGSVTVSEGIYRIWMRISATPEHPVKAPGMLCIF